MSMLIQWLLFSFFFKFYFIFKLYIIVLVLPNIKMNPPQVYMCSLAHFLIGSFIFLELSCRSCVYIFEINSLSVASFAIIFSHSEGCLFTLLLVSLLIVFILYWSTPD